MTGSGRNLRVDRIFPTSGTLEVDGNLDFSKVGRSFIDSIGVGTALTQANLHVMGNAYVSSNLEVGQANLFVDTQTSKIGVGTTEPDATLHVDGNAYVSSNLEVGQANLFVDTQTSKIGVGTTEPDATLHVDGNAYVSSNLEVGQANLFVDTQTSRVGVGTIEPDATLHVDGNAYVSSNLHVEGNAFVSSNLEVSGNVRITDGLSNVCELSTFGISSWDETGYKIEASDGFNGALFGDNVSISGDYAIVGSPGGGGGGQAYIYKRGDGNTWGQEAKFTHPTETGNYIKFGGSVSIDGDYAIVGAYMEPNPTESGAVFIYRRTGTNTWDSGYKIKESPANSNSNFGISVSISGDYAIVGRGHPYDYAYIYHRTGTNTWGTVYTLPEPSSVTFGSSYFGRSVSISGDYAIAGIAHYSAFRGRAIIYHRTGTNTWDTGTIIEPAGRPSQPTTSNDEFGNSVSISGDYAIVGAPSENYIDFENVGAAYIYKRTDTNTWDNVTRIVSPYSSYEYGFGSFVSIDGDYAIVGTSSGHAYSFRMIGTNTNTWDTGTRILKNVPAESSYGNSVSVNGSYVIVGARNMTTTVNRNAGAAYIHTRADVARLNISEPIVTRSGTVLSFTGQHICFPEGPMNEGLVVSANKNKYVSLNGSLTTGSHAIKSSEALPIVSLSNVANDRSVFGVVDHFEMGGNTRSQKSGIGIITQDKEIGDNRVIVNSLGEGGIWVADTNGNVASGDFMTTSHLPGYAQRQDDDILRNSTVAKSTMECDFNPLDIPVQKIKKDENGTNILDTYGRLQWEDTDRTEKAYRVRYLTSEGELTDEANAVHTAAFIGCTYHCG